MIGLVYVLGVTAVGVAVMWCVLNTARVGSLLARLSRWAGLVECETPVPTCIPIERISADLRRIRAEFVRLPAGMPMAKRRGIMAAYDDALVDACKTLEVTTELNQVEGFEHEIERIRTEQALEHAGVCLH